MPDLTDLFRRLDGLEAPDLREEAARRLGNPERPAPPFGLGPGRQKALAIVVALLVSIAAGAYAWRAATLAGSGPATPAPSPAADPLASIPPGWTELPAPPEQTSGSAIVWAGSELIRWGGYVHDDANGNDTYEANGSAFDPTTGSWDELPPAPAGRAGAKALWTGTEALFLFGYDDARTYEDGFAFNPTTRSWRTVSSAPLDQDFAVAVWTGTEVVVWGGGRGADGGESSGAAYDPVTDSWRAIADAPLGLNLASGVWTGDRLIVFGSLLDNRNRASTNTSVGAIYDPASDAWQEMPPSQLSPQATSAVWTGDRMIAWDYEVHSQEFDPPTNSWTDPIKMPLQFSECYPDSVGVPSYVFAWFCGDAALYDVATGEWKRIHGGMLEPTVEANGASYQLWRFAFLVPAGDVIFFEAEGITVSKSGTPCYGCRGSPTSFWAYRP